MKIFSTVLAVPLVALVFAYRAWAAALIWNWHIAQLGAPSINWVHATVAFMCFSAMTSKPRGPDPEDKRSELEKNAAFGVWLALPLVFVAVAWGLRWLA